MPHSHGDVHADPLCAAALVWPRGRSASIETADESQRTPVWHAASRGWCVHNRRCLPWRSCAVRLSSALRRRRWRVHVGAGALASECSAQQARSPHPTLCCLVHVSRCTRAPTIVRCMVHIVCCMVHILRCMVHIVRCMRSRAATCVTRITASRLTRAAAAGRWMRIASVPSLPQTPTESILIANCRTASGGRMLTPFESCLGLGSARPGLGLAWRRDGRQHGTWRAGLLPEQQASAHGTVCVRVRARLGVLMRARVRV